MTTRNPYVGLHPDLFAKGGRPEHLGLPTKLEPGGMTPEQRRRHEAIQEGMTPVFVPLSDLTSEQIRELPRSAFSQNLPQLLRRHGAVESDSGASD